MNLHIKCQQNTFLIVVCFWTFTFSTVNGIHNDITRGVKLFNTAYDTWSDTKLKKADAHFSALKNWYPHTYEPLYWLTVVNFYLVTYYLFGMEKDYNKKTAELYLKKAIAYANEAILLYPEDAESYALLGTMNGINITFKPLTAVAVGSSVSKNIRKAQELAPQNPRVLYLIGMSYYHTPAILGGGFKKGLYYLQKAEAFFHIEKKKKLDSHIPQWGFSTCLSFIGNVYFKKNMLSEAKQYYIKALNINPSDKQAQKGLNDIQKNLQLKE